MKFPAYDNREFLEFDQGIENTRTGNLYAGSGLLSGWPTRQIAIFRFSHFRNEESHSEPVFLEQRLRMEFIGIGLAQPCGGVYFDEIRHGAPVAPVAAGAA